MSTKKPKRTTKPTAKKKPAKTKTTRVTRVKKKPEKTVPSEVKKPLVETEISEPKKPIITEPVPEIKKPITRVEPEVKPPAEIKPESKPEEPVEITKPEIVQAKPEPEKAEERPTPPKPVAVAETPPQPQREETKKTILEVKAEAKPSIISEPKKRAVVKKPLPKPLPKKKLPEPAKDSMLLIIRLRGTFGVPNDIERTLQNLRLRNKFNATLVRNNPSTIGMLRQVKDYITWGDLKPTDIAQLLRERGEVNGRKPVTDKFANDAFSKESIDLLAKALTTGEVSLQSLWKKGVKPIFRLHPPSGGFESTIKRSFTSNGQLGYRGSAIATLMTQMS